MHDDIHVSAIIEILQFPAKSEWCFVLVILLLKWWPPLCQSLHFIGILLTENTWLQLSCISNHQNYTISFKKWVMLFLLCILKVFHLSPNGPCHMCIQWCFVIVQIHQYNAWFESCQFISPMIHKLQILAWNGLCSYRKWAHCTHSCQLPKVPRSCPFPL